MAQLKKQILSIIRGSGLSKVADDMRFAALSIKNFKRNRAFYQEYPGVALPPAYMVYESFQIDYRKYFEGGREDAEWIASLAKPFLQNRLLSILDWGCGPARIIRHLPALLGEQHQYFGTDYNAGTIAWCKSNIPNISFSENQLFPPLPLAANQFDLIYGISILTHLSEENHLFWVKELHRILSPSGVLILTTHGDAFLEKLTAEETQMYHSQKIVTRHKTKEGHRTYGSFHPPAFVRELFIKNGLQIASHLPGQKVTASYISQDVWILNKV